MAANFWHNSFCFSWLLMFSLWNDIKRKNTLFKLFKLFKLITLFKLHFFKCHWKMKKKINNDRTKKKAKKKKRIMESEVRNTTDAYKPGSVYPPFLYLPQATSGNCSSWVTSTVFFPISTCTLLTWHGPEDKRYMWNPWSY